MREWRRLHAADIYKEQPDMIPSARDVESRMRERLETGKCFDKPAPSYPTIKNIAEPQVEFRTQPTLPTMNFPNKQDKCCDTCGGIYDVLVISLENGGYIVTKPLLKEKISRVKAGSDIKVKTTKLDFIDILWPTNGDEYLP